MHFAPVHARHGFETMRLCEHIKSQGLGPLSRERGDEHDDYHDWLESEGLRDYRYTPGGEYAFDSAMPASYPPEAHPTAWIEREVSAFLSARRDDRPLFLVISFPHPHAPYDPPEPYRSMYDPADSVLPSDGYEVNEELPLVFRLATSGELALPDANSRPEAEDPLRVRAFLATVRGLIRQVDDALGRLVAQLDLDGSLLFFTSDHGDYAGHRGLMRKHPWIPFDDLAPRAVLRHRTRCRGRPADPRSRPELRPGAHLSRLRRCRAARRRGLRQPEPPPDHRGPGRAGRPRSHRAVGHVDRLPDGPAWPVQVHRARRPGPARAVRPRARSARDHEPRRGTGMPRHRGRAGARGPGRDGPTGARRARVHVERAAA